MTLDAADVVKRAEAFVRERMSGDASGHDWQHVDRVRRMALYLADHEGGNRFLIELAALLHDVDDWKLRQNGDEHLVARPWLVECGCPEPLIASIEDIIERLSFKGAGTADEMPTFEGRIVQDADRLDAIGAIGIARCFAYGGHKGRALYDPGISPVRHASFAEYQLTPGSSLNHFDEKLLLLKDRMHTVTARRLAEQRHRVLLEFQEQFLREWNFPNSP